MCHLKKAQPHLMYLLPVDKNDKLLACKYRATKNKANKKPKVIFMLSTRHQPSMELTDRADGENVMKPSIIKRYNKHMGGVYRVD